LPQEEVVEEKEEALVQNDVTRTKPLEVAKSPIYLSVPKIPKM